MRCPNPKCGKDGVVATDTRAGPTDGPWIIKRRRRCDACGHRFTTTELTDAEHDRLTGIEATMRGLMKGGNKS